MYDPRAFLIVIFIVTSSVLFVWQSKQDSRKTRGVGSTRAMDDDPRAIAANEQTKQFEIEKMEQKKEKDGKAADAVIKETVRK